MRIGEWMRRLAAQTWCGLLPRERVTIPTFQRPFVWSAEQRLKLFDSIIQELPIQGITMWLGDVSHQPVVGGLLVGEGSSSCGVSLLALDGRQRLTTLFAALGDGVWTREGKPAPRVESRAPDGEPWSLSYDIQRKRLVTGEPPNCYPLRLVVDGWGTDEWLAKLPSALRTRRRYRTVRSIRNKILDYPLGYTIFDGTPSQAAEAFARLNRQGTRVSDADILFAKELLK